MLTLLHARAAERVGDQPRPGMAGRPLRGPADVEALLRRFEFGDAVVRRVELHLPAAGRAHGQVQLEVQERCDEEWRWTSIVFVVDGLQAFRLTQGRTTYQVLTGPPVIVQAPDGTWVVDLARDLELQEPPVGRWYDSPQFLQGSDVSWHCSPSRREPEDAARFGGVHGHDDEAREGGPDLVDGDAEDPLCR